VRLELEEREDREDAIDDEPEYRDEEDLDDDYLPAPNSKATRELRKRVDAELDQLAEKGGAEPDDHEQPPGGAQQRVRYTIGGDEEDVEDGEEVVVGEDGVGMKGELKEMRLKPFEAENDEKLQDYEDKLADFTDRALDAMGDEKYLNFEKAQKVNSFFFFFFFFFFFLVFLYYIIKK
jgi:hypothetical protein